METLISLIKHSSVFDLLTIIVIILITLIMIPAGIWIVIASRSRKPIYFLLLFAMLPLLLSLCATFLRIWQTEKLIAEFPDAGAETVAQARSEAWATTYIGAAGTILIGVIAVPGLILRKERSA